MFQTLIALICFYIAFIMRENTSASAPAIKHLLTIFGIIMLLADSYVYFILPSEISKFYNDGAGLSYTNPSGETTTLFSDTDYKVGYFLGQVKLDYDIIALLQFAAYFSLLLLGLLITMHYLGHYNIMGKRVQARDEHKQESA